MAGLEERLPLLDEILEAWSEPLGDDYEAYRNHVYRVVNFCFALHQPSSAERSKIVIAGCFHDLGIWAGGTFDYLPPSIAAAVAYLKQNSHAAWIPEVEMMIGLHHKLRRFSDESYPLVEPFRRADLADFSLGLFRGGVSGQLVRAAKRAFPNAGFHKRLVQLEIGWLARHPLRPVPVVKW
jgi:hypothetical protein